MVTKSKKTGLALFREKVKAITKQEGTLREKYQELGIQAMAHYAEHGDTSYMGVLLYEIGDNSPYRPLMLKWLKAYAPVVTRGVTDNEKQMLILATKNGEKHTSTDVEEANKHSFWMVNGAPGRLVEFDEMALLERMIKRHADMSDPEKIDKERFRVVKVLPDEAMNLLRRAMNIAGEKGERLIYNNEGGEQTPETEAATTKEEKAA